MKQHTYIAIDLKSFYASVECRERGLDPLDTNLVVADESRTDNIRVNNDTHIIATLLQLIHDATEVLPIPYRTFSKKFRVLNASGIRLAPTEAERRVDFSSG